MRAREACQSPPPPRRPAPGDLGTVVNVASRPSQPFTGGLIQAAALETLLTPGSSFICFPGLATRRVVGRKRPLQ